MIKTILNGVAARMTEAGLQKDFWCVSYSHKLVEKKIDLKKNNCTVIKLKRLFVNCQQHKYFVLLFVPFSIKTEKIEQKRERVCCFERVFLVPLQSWFPNTVQYIRNLADKSCNIEAELACPCQPPCVINKVSPPYKTRCPPHSLAVSSFKVKCIRGNHFQGIILND